MAQPKKQKTNSENTSNENAKTATKSATNTTNNSSANGVLFLVVGLILGLIVGGMFTSNTNSSNKQAANSKTGKARPLKGDEKMPANHPSVDNEEVEKEIQRAVEAGEKNQDYDTQFKVGGYLYSQGRVEQAKKYLLKAQELKPSEFEPMAQLGNICFDLGQERKDTKLVEEAINWYEKAIKVKSDDLNVLTDTGIAYTFLSPPNYKKALEYIEKTLSKDPKHLQSLYHKARISLATKDLKTAQEAFNSFKETASSVENENVKAALASLEEELNKAKDGQQIPIPTH
jgi:tetratricopeptide (TPR) repeat protein